MISYRCVEDGNGGAQAVKIMAEILQEVFLLLVHFSAARLKPETVEEKNRADGKMK